MSNTRRIALLAAGLLVGLTGCDATGQQRAADAGPVVQRDEPRDETKSNTMKLTIGTKTFKATLDDNPAAAKLRAMLPLTLDMAELNGNEKYARLSDAAPDRCHGPRDDPERRPHALGGRYAGALLQGLPDHLQLHPARANRRPGGAGGCGRVGEREGDLRA